VQPVGCTAFDDHARLKDNIMNDELLIELGVASEVTKGCVPAHLEGYIFLTHRDC
jgi:hypothetical protein